MRVLSIDIETKDPYLKKFSSGARLGGVILCMCAATDDEMYIDLNKREMQLLIDQCDWIVGSNIQYDLDYLNLDTTGKKICDVLATERLLDTTSIRVNLGTLAEKYLGQKKLTDELDEYASANKIKKVMENLDKLPRQLMLKYCYMDCKLALDVFNAQYPIVKDMTGFHIEVGIQTVIREMRKQGVPFDVEKAKLLSAELLIEINRLGGEIETKFGTTNFKTDEGKKVLATYCNDSGVTFQMTTKTNKPQFDAKFFMKYTGQEAFQMITKYQELCKLRSDFVEKLIGVCVDGKIYPNINPMKGEQGGAITGRFSMSKPNLQQLSSRNPEWSSKIRDQFAVADGCKWVKLDYSAQEVRVFLSFAAGSGGAEAEEFVRKFQEDPYLDPYLYAAEIAKAKGRDIPRPVMKTIILAMQYCMGPKKLGQTLNCTEDEARELLNAFNELFPFMKRFQRQVLDVVERRGKTQGEAFITTLAGRKIYLQIDKLPVNVAGSTMSFVKKVRDTYKAINYLVQGSSADITKRAMLNVFNKLGVAPLVSIHDELGFAILDPDIEQVVPQIIECMENTYDISIPMKVSCDVGSSWGEYSKYAIRIMDVQEPSVTDAKGIEECAAR